MQCLCDLLSYQAIWELWCTVGENRKLMCTANVYNMC